MKNRRVKQKDFEYYFERGLWKSRFLILIAVIGLLIGAVIAFWLGIENLVRAFTTIIHNQTSNMTLVYLISSIDEFLLAIVMIIMSLGVYELFISEIDAKEGKVQYPTWLQFHSLEELKAVLTKVIIIILLVYFFKSVVVMKFDTPLSILYLGGGIILVALADFLTRKVKIHDHK